MSLYKDNPIHMPMQDWQFRKVLWAEPVTRSNGEHLVGVKQCDLYSHRADTGLAKVISVLRKGPTAYFSPEYNVCGTYFHSMRVNGRWIENDEGEVIDFEGQSAVHMNRIAYINKHHDQALRAAGRHARDDVWFEDGIPEEEVDRRIDGLLDIHAERQAAVVRRLTGLPVGTMLNWFRDWMWLYNGPDGEPYFLPQDRHPADVLDIKHLRATLVPPQMRECHPQPLTTYLRHMEVYFHNAALHAGCNPNRYIEANLTPAAVQDRESHMYPLLADEVAPVAMVDVDIHATSLEFGPAYFYGVHP